MPLLGGGTGAGSFAGLRQRPSLPRRQAWALAVGLQCLRGGPLPAYPMRPRLGDVSRISWPASADRQLFHAGSRQEAVAAIVTAGGRVLGRGGPGEGFRRRHSRRLTPGLEPGALRRDCFIAGDIVHQVAALLGWAKARTVGLCRPKFTTGAAPISPNLARPARPG